MLKNADMKILQVSNKPPYPPRDGGSMAMFNLANGLRKLGHEITVLTMFTNKHRLTVEQHKEYSKLMKVHTVYVDTNISWTGLALNLLFSDKPYTATRFHSQVFGEELAKILKAEQFDLIQLEGLYLTVYIPLIRNYSNAKIVLRAHNVEHVIWERVAAEEKKYYRRTYLDVVARRTMEFEFNALNTYDLLVPITSIDLDKFTEMGNTKPAHVSPAGVNVDPDHPCTYYPDSAGKNFTLYYLGSLDWIPNQEGLRWFAAKVFPGIRREHHDTRFHVAGRNAPLRLINDIVQPGVIYHGEVADAKEFSKNYTVLVAPCFSGSGMRLKILEAMAIGKAVITTKIGAEGLSVTDGENLLIADDALSFQNAVEKLRNDPEYCRKLGMEAYKLIYEKYNNSDIAASLAAFYNNHIK
jgi:glycosyltransferase involved in cell wall biosynthesis